MSALFRPKMDPPFSKVDVSPSHLTPKKEITEYDATFHILFNVLDISELSYDAHILLNNLNDIWGLLELNAHDLKLNGLSNRTFKNIVKLQTWYYEHPFTNYSGWLQVDESHFTKRKRRQRFRKRTHQPKPEPFYPKEERSEPQIPIVTEIDKDGNVIEIQIEGQTYRLIEEEVKVSENDITIVKDDEIENPSDKIVNTTTTSLKELPKPKPNYQVGHFHVAHSTPTMPSVSAKGSLNTWSFEPWEYDLFDENEEVPKHIKRNISINHINVTSPTFVTPIENTHEHTSQWSFNPWEELPCENNFSTADEDHKEHVITFEEQDNLLDYGEESFPCMSHDGHFIGNPQVSCPDLGKFEEASDEFPPPKKEKNILPPPDPGEIIEKKKEKKDLEEKKEKKDLEEKKIYITPTYGEPTGLNKVSRNEKELLVSNPQTLLSKIITKETEAQALKPIEIGIITRNLNHFMDTSQPVPKLPKGNTFISHSSMLKIAPYVHYYKSKFKTINSNIFEKDTFYFHIKKDHYKDLYAVFTVANINQLQNYGEHQISKNNRIPLSNGENNNESLPELWGVSEENSSRIHSDSLLYGIQFQSHIKKLNLPQLLKIWIQYLLMLS